MPASPGTVGIFWLEKRVALAYVLCKMFEFKLSIPQADDCFRNLIIVTTTKPIKIGSIEKNYLETGTAGMQHSGGANAWENTLFSIWMQSLFGTGSPVSVTSLRTVSWLGVTKFQKLRGLLSNIDRSALWESVFFRSLCAL